MKPVPNLLQKATGPDAHARVWASVYVRLMHTMKTYNGSCHCGAVTFSLESEIEKVIECNCSHCARKGFLLHFVPGTQFTLLSGEENLTEYRFNKMHIAHLFCKTCGVQCFGKATNQEGVETVAVNVRTLPDLDISALTIEHFDGKNY